MCPSRGCCPKSSGAGPRRKARRRLPKGCRLQNISVTNYNLPCVASLEAGLVLTHGGSGILHAAYASPASPFELTQPLPCARMPSARMLLAFALS